MMYFVKCSQNGITVHGQLYSTFRFRDEDCFHPAMLGTQVSLYGKLCEIGKEYLLEIKEAPEPQL